MQASGIVKKIYDDKIELSVFKESACAHCNKCSEKQKITKTYTLKIDRKVKIGDIVTIDIEDRDVLKAASIVYIIPIFFMFFGYFIGLKFNFSEGKCIFTSFLSLLVSFLGIFIYDKKLPKDKFEKNIKIIKIEEV